MRLRTRNPRSSAMTIFEVMVVIVCLLVLAAMLLPMLAGTGHHRSGLNCVINLREINIGLRIWEGDNASQYPMSVSVTNGGAMELIEAGDVTKCFQTASNELMTTTKIFICPYDSGRTYAKNWNDLNGSHISYFLSPDASEDHPERIMDGDDNLIVGGMPVKSGMHAVYSNTPINWSATRHVHVGNIGLADGSVLQTTSSSLERAFQGTGLATNRIVIP